MYEILISCRNASCQNDLLHFNLVIFKVLAVGFVMWSTFFLRALVKLRKATFGFMTSFSPHGTMGSNRMDFHEILYLRIFRNTVQNHGLQQDGFSLNFIFDNFFEKPSRTIGSNRTDFHEILYLRFFSKNRSEPSASTGRIFMKFYIWDFFRKTVQDNRLQQDGFSLNFIFEIFFEKPSRTIGFNRTDFH
jgi:hypothetical protein